MPAKRSSSTKWKREHKIALASICVAAAIGIVTIGVNISKRTAPNSNTATLAVNNSPGAVTPMMVGSPNSTQIVKLNERTLFVPPSENLRNGVLRRLSELKLRHSEVPISVVLEVESNSSQRFKAAKILGGLLSTSGLGHFWQSTCIGISPSHPITIFFGQEDDKLAKELSVAIEPLVRGDTLFARAPHLGTNVCRLYLNGTPIFQSDGQITFE